MYVCVCNRIEKKLVSEVDDIDNINDSDFPSLVTNIPKFSILSVSTLFLIQISKQEFLILILFYIIRNKILSD